MRIKFVSRQLCWWARSAACFTPPVAMSPPKLTSTTTSSASKSSWQRTTASPHTAGLPLVVRSASTAYRPSLSSAQATMPTFVAAAGWIDADSDLFDHLFRHVVDDQPVVFEQRIHRVEDHRALQLLAAQARALVKLPDFVQERRRQVIGIVVGRAARDPD